MTFFDTNSKDIILISYPSGGFGNFLYHILTEFADQTVKVSNNNFSFSKSGNSHDTIKYTNTYFHDPDNYEPLIDNKVDTVNKKILVLCDNGIDNDSYHKIKKKFSSATIVRIVIDSFTMPVIYGTMVKKAMQTDLLSATQEHVNANWIDYNEAYAVRENFTLLYHNWPFKWHALDDCINVSLEHLITDPINALVKLIHDLNMQVLEVNKLEITVTAWCEKNSEYFRIYHEKQKIEHSLNHNLNYYLDHIVDLHNQGYLNYWLEKKYNLTIPVYDYKDWFKDTHQILQMVKNINERKNTCN